MFCRLCRPAVPPENFLQPTCPQMKPASRPKLYPCAQGEPTRFFLDSKMPKETLIYTFFAFIRPSAWSTPLKNSRIEFSAKFATKKLKPPKRYDHFWKIQGSLRGHTFQSQKMPNLGNFELRVINASQTGTGKSDDLRLAHKMAGCPT